MSNQIPGVPEGWDLVHANRLAEAGEFILTEEGDPYMTSTGSGRPYPIIRKIEKPAKYRPFANAEEYLPEADRKISRVANGGQQTAGFLRSTGCDSLGIWVDGAYRTFLVMFKRGHVFLDDGTPFGAKIDE